MRRVLDGLYLACGILGATFLVLILLVVCAQVALNVADAVAGRLTGRAIGLLIPSYATFAGYFLAAGSFFALAYAFAHGTHIRVTLALQHMPAAPRRIAEVGTAALATVLSGYFAWFMLALTRESLRFGDLSSGLVAIPLWIPQSAMTAGLVALTIAAADRTLRAARGDIAAGEGDERLLQPEPERTDERT